MPFVLAHFGHWYVSIIYVAPVFVLVGWLKIVSARDKRRVAAEGGGSPDGEPGSEDVLGEAHDDGHRRDAGDEGEDREREEQARVG